MMRVRLLVVHSIVAALVVSLAPPAGAVIPAGTMVSVTTPGDPDPIPVRGAFVAVSGSGGSRAATTNAAGELDQGFDLADGTYRYSVSAPNFEVASGEFEIAGATTLPVVLAPSDNPFAVLGAFGAQTSGIVADGLSGVFYLSTTSIPSLYRTGDYGGTWAPVTLDADDPAGIDGSTTASSPVTSGYPGEIAAIVGSKVWFSQDFGNTWESIPAPPVGAGGSLLWGHPDGADSILFAVNGSTDEMFFAAMPAAPGDPAPGAFTAMSESYKASAGDVVSIANGGGASFVAVAHASGLAASGDPPSGVTIYRVDVTPSAADGSINLPGANAGGIDPTFVRLGGPLDGQAIGADPAPNTVLVYAHRSEDGAATLTAYRDTDANDVRDAWVSTSADVFHAQDTDAVAAGAWSQEAGSPNSCGGMSGSIGSISPAGEAGTVGMCWVTQEAADGSELHARPIRFINNNTGIAFDAAYGETNTVLISGDGEKGATKSTVMATDGEGDPLNRPRFGTWPEQAEPGTGDEADGVSIEGIYAAVVRDMDFGPDEGQGAAALSFTGGGRILGTVDGASTFVDLAYEGGDAVEWWSPVGGGSGAHAAVVSGSPSWLAAANGAGPNLLRAADVPADPTTEDLGNILAAEIPGTGPMDLGHSDSNARISALTGLTGQDQVYIGVSSNTPGMPGGEGRLARATLSGSRLDPGGVAAVVDPSIGDLANPVAALASCAGMAHASVADSVFAALGETASGAADGGVAVVSGASTADPTVAMAEEAGTGEPLTGDFTDVRVDCVSGIVWASRSSGAGMGPMVLAPASPPLLVSEDGGQTFAEVVLPGDVEDVVGSVETFDVDAEPDAPAEIVIVSGQGDVASSPDGGETWIVANDTDGGRNFGGEMPGDVEIFDIPEPPAVDSFGAAADAGGVALLGSGSGLFSATVTDTTPPSAPSLGALPLFQTSRNVNIKWSASSDAESGISLYKVRYRRRAFGSSSFQSFTFPWAQAAGTATTRTFLNLATKYLHCFRLYGVNGVGTLSASSAERCTVVPASDRDLSRVGTWSLRTGAGRYLNTWSETTVVGRELRLSVNGAKRVDLIVSKCSTCGTVDVYIGSVKVARKALTGSGLRQFVTVYSSGTARSGTLRIRVVTNGKPVRIEGVAVKA